MYLDTCIAGEDVAQVKAQLSKEDREKRGWTQLGVDGCVYPGLVSVYTLAQYPCTPRPLWAMCVPWPNKAACTSWPKGSGTSRPKGPGTSWTGSAEGQIFPVMAEITYRSKNSKAQHQ